jgi:hypothetical protein
MSAVDDIKLYFFHHHHYIDVPEDNSDIRSTWVVPPVELFDAKKGTRSTSGTCARFALPTSSASTASASTSTTTPSTR